MSRLSLASSHVSSVERPPTRLATELSSGLEVLYSWSMINVARGAVGIPSFTGGDDYASASQVENNEN